MSNIQIICKQVKIPFTAAGILSFAAMHNIAGVLVKTRRNGREIREYVVCGECIRAEAWYTEHVISLDD